MIKTVETLKCDITQQNSDGAFVEYSYCCPHCQQYVLESSFIEGYTSNDSTSSHITHHICPFCNKLNKVSLIP